MPIPSIVPKIKGACIFTGRANKGEHLCDIFKCQFIIATHSPFVLAMKDALIYDLDRSPVRQADWRSLENVQEYYAFFKEHEEELESFYHTGK